MGHLVKAINAHDAAAPGIGQAVFADFADWLVSVNDGVAGINTKVLRITAEFHQENIAGLQFADAGQAGLVIEGRLKQAIAGQTGVAAVVDVLQIQRFGDMDNQAGTIKGETIDAALMHKGRAQAFAGGGNYIGGDHDSVP